jgi:uncharacterized membrane protein YecN with MAPEG domain
LPPFSPVFCRLGFLHDTGQTQVPITQRRAELFLVWLAFLFGELFRIFL